MFKILLEKMLTQSNNYSLLVIIHKSLEKLKTHYDFDSIHLLVLDHSVTILFYIHIFCVTNDFFSEKGQKNTSKRTRAPLLVENLMVTLISFSK